MSTSEQREYFDLVMARLKKKLNVNSDSGLASLLELSPPAFANRKKGASIPYENVIRLALEEHLEMTEIFGVGEGPPPDIGAVDEAGRIRAIDAKVLEDPWADYELIERKGLLGAAGGGAENVILQQRGALAFRRNWLRYKNVTAREIIVVDIDGDSMEKTLFHKDTVCFREQDSLAGEDVYLFELEAKLYVKRLHYQPGTGIEVISDNKAYRPFTLSEREAENQGFAVKGRFLWRGGDRLQ